MDGWYLRAAPAPFWGAGHPRSIRLSKPASLATNFLSRLFHFFRLDPKAHRISAGQIHRFSQYQLTNLFAIT
jgi:hypothetical protein